MNILPDITKLQFDCNNLLLLHLTSFPTGTDQIQVTVMLILRNTTLRCYVVDLIRGCRRHRHALHRSILRKPLEPFLSDSILNLFVLPSTNMARAGKIDPAVIVSVSVNAIEPDDHDACSTKDPKKKVGDCEESTM